MRKYQPGCPCCADSSGGKLPCWPCSLPKRDLTVSWTNVLNGNGSVRFVYQPPGVWSTGCTNGVLFTLTCGGGLKGSAAVCPSGLVTSMS